MLLIHDTGHFRTVRRFAEENGRWEQLEGELKTLADYFECGEDSLDKHRQFRESYPFDENFPLELTGTEKTRCLLYKDFAPYSFYFEIQTRKMDCGVKPGGEKGTPFWTGTWQRYMNGGLIFHGPHDNGGDGGPPTFSVNLSPTDGWSIHT